MTITIEMTPELEHQLQQAAAQAGLTPDAYIVQTLRERLTPPQPSRDQTQRLSAAEARAGRKASVQARACRTPRTALCVRAPESCSTLACSKAQWAG